MRLAEVRLALASFSFCSIMIPSGYCSVTLIGPISSALHLRAGLVIGGCDSLPQTQRNRSLDGVVSAFFHVEE